MKVRIPSPLRSYTNGKKEVDIEGKTLIEIIDNLDNQFKGIKFRFINEQGEIRDHMKIFVNSNLVTDLIFEINNKDVIFIIQALSGGIE